MQELVRRGVGSHDIDVAMREAFGPDMQKLHIQHDSAVEDGDQEAVGRYSKASPMHTYACVSCKTACEPSSRLPAVCLGGVLWCWLLWRQPEM